jgi:hypothetical protein
MVMPVFITAFFVVLWVVSEFRCLRWVRLTLGIGAIGLSIGLTMFFAYFERVDLADNYAAANSNLTYAIEAAIKEGRSDKVVSVLATFRENRPHFDLGTPPDYYRAIESLAGRVNPSNEPGRQ